jgi:lysophospholipase L1-like esterase
MKPSPPPGLGKTLGKLARGEPVTIVALGDSNTELTWHTAGRLNWVGLLQEALFEKHGANLATVINAGRCGDTAAAAVTRLDRDVTRFRPDLVIVAFSMNDAFQGKAGLAAFSEGIRRIVGELREKCACEVLLRTTNPVVAMNAPELPRGHVPGEEPPGLAHELYAARLVKLGRELRCPVVDHYALWKGARRRRDWGQDPNHLWMRMSDAAHPNALGHLCFYRELAPLFGLPARFPWEG